MNTSRLITAIGLACTLLISFAAVAQNAATKPATDQPPFPAAQAGKTVKIAVIGDGAARFGPPLEKLLGNGYQVKSFCTNDHSILRTNLRCVWKRYESVKAEAYKPDVFILMFEHAASRPNTWTHDAGRYVGDYKDFIARLKGKVPAAQVYICLPPPLKPDCHYGVNAEQLTKGVLPAIRKVAAETKLPLIDTHTPLTANLDANVGGDGVFPTPEGAELMAAVIYKSLTGKEAPTAATQPAATPPK
ncbi:MAG: GDSL-type esterase/lipase family protein [Planctomycetaceae bacterium]|nr:GDSL-type esterase/lipase family protein [Planctomycetaceae bacterium]